MKRSFKRIAVAVGLQPGRGLLLMGVTLLFFSLLLKSSLLYLVACVSLIPAAIWQHVKAKPLGTNFAYLPSMPLLDGRPYYFVYQRRRKDVKGKSCKELTRSLIQDKGVFAAQLLPGTYITITHDVVIHILQTSSSIRILSEPIPVYQCSLRSTLLHFTGGRCKHCKQPCKAWESEARTFYIVKFEADTPNKKGR